MEFNSWFSNPWFWGIFVALGYFGFAKKIPVINRLKKNTMVMIGIAGLLFTTGVLNGLGLGSMATTTSSGVQISDIQATTAFLTDAGGTIGESGAVDDLWDVRAQDAQANETTDIYEVDTGILTVRRTGDLSPNSCTVSCVHPAPFVDEGTGVGPEREIIEVDSVGRHECWLSDGAAATSASAKDTTQLTFSDGASSRTLGVALDVDEEAHDYLDQYGYKDVVIDVCGKPFTFRIHRMDA